MDFLVKISGNGDMVLENSEGISQYVAKYKNNSFEGIIFDDLAITELVSVKSKQDEFVITAFDSPVASFKKTASRFVYESSEHRIEQQKSSFVIFNNDTESARIERAEKGFLLSISDGLSPLMGFALVILIIAAKTKESQLNQSENAKATAPATTEKEQPIVSKAKSKQPKEKPPKKEGEKFDFVKFKALIIAQSKSILSKFPKLKCLKNGSKTALAIMLVAIIGFTTTLLITSSQNEELAKLKKQEVYRIGKEVCEIKFEGQNKTYTFETPKDYVENTPLYIYYTEKTKKTKEGKQTVIDKFYSSYPSYIDFSIPTVLLIATAIISAFVYVLTAFNLLNKETLDAIKASLKALKKSEDAEDETLDNQE